ncbi:MAG TPA: acyltransferase [Bacteroidales bacterium]|nr:acyltransferase [Bacteroidales bacterium]HPE40771.1 acyltransferase [Bacteroidales bacterium]
MNNKLFRSIQYRIRRFFAGLSKPTMIYGYRSHNGVYLKDTRISTSTAIVSPENLDIADHVFVGHFNFIEASNRITIGEGVQITNFVSITSHSSHNAIRLYGKAYRRTTKDIAYVKGSIVIGSYTFVGPHTLILPGTTIGKGCVISAYSKVSGTFPDYSIITGNPAKVVGTTRKIDQAMLEKYPELKDSYYDQDSL